MNISQWIKSVEQAVPLNESPLSTDQPHTLLKRGRGSRTSSLLEPFTNQEKRGKKGKQPAIYIDSSSSDTSDATSGSTSSRSTSQPSSSSSNRYRRRPRHHTKADKYNSSSRSKPQQKRREKKKKIERQKRTKHSRRNKHKSKEATGVVQTFKAKNVPKDRLTLDPGTKFGLYTKGRSSGPTKGKGLPDLVFSEMRFLQKPESSTKEEPKRKSQKKKRRQSAGKEISRYFDAGAMRPGDDGITQRRHMPPLDTPGVAKSVHIASPVISNLLAKPFLGFGSRGSHPPPTSYSSWSDSGKESSARMAHSTQDLEPLAAGQLHSHRAQQEMQATLLEQDTAQRRSTPEQFSKNQNPILEPAQKIKQIDQLPVKPQDSQELDTETMPVPISATHETFVPVATSLVNQSQREWHSANRTLPTDETTPSMPKDHEPCSTKPTQAGLFTDPVWKQYLEPWEELLQNCELAAQPPVPTYYDEDLPRYSLPAIGGRGSIETYNHANFPLWSADVDHFIEYDYPDNAALMSEDVHWTQPGTNNYQEVIASFSGEMMDEAPESLDSEDDHELATEDAVERNIDHAVRYNGLQDGQIRDDETTDDFAMFWQPNKLY